ncbi:Beta-ketoacyl synthase [Macrophomina phaseolina MS6]|uniref:Beta-ketoacyl synthase n=1 Tax=Macrophomina phaseolina (strain MS6) TaxID=1126212 RepID=K2SST2_MACPH|nr:Beta-ketoacyl synthase [Macrophomina phaseolina MS6]
MPADRFNVDAFYHPLGTNKGTTNARYGYFLDQSIDEFDNEFFRISRKEAESMDPQQRLLLEVVYEALEDAGIPMEQMRGTRTAVYVGSFSNDYNAMLTKDLAQYPKYTVTGGGNAILSNRISYFFDLHGPSVTVDTACSSSLICFHFGNQSLQSGESDIAIVAGSALHFDPNIFITMTDFGMLSSDGRCRTFDANGTGYVRGEGVAAIVLKRRSQAEAAGDRIRAVVRGTGANHDGSKSGLTLPNGKAQAGLIRSTYKAAGLDVAHTDYFEAHGTGTKAGDPIEANAIGSVFAQARSTPLMVGSIKSNVGHLEGASGLAGIIKATMSVEAAKIFPNMHFNTPNPEIDFDRLKIKVPTELCDWETATGLRRASINSFGYGGSNAHVILENYRPRGTALNTQPLALTPLPCLIDNTHAARPYLLPLTSHNEKAAKNLATDLAAWLRSHPNLRPADVAYSLSVRRSMHQLRSFAIGHDRSSLLQSLTDPLPVAKWTRRSEMPPRLGFVFTGQGAQWHAMGRELLDKSPLFQQTLERCDAVLQTLPDRPDWTCARELRKSADKSRVAQSIISQPLCAAVQLALVDHLRAWGIVPTAVVGHSSGEIAAAYAAGILSFENAIICAFYRGLYMSQSSDKRGAMIAVGMSEAEGRAELQAYQGRVALAAVNSPSSLTLSGDEDAVLALKEKLEDRRVFVRQLRVEQAFHSHHMVPLAPGFERALSTTRGFSPAQAQCQMVSSVTARDSEARSMDAAYWAANMTGVVRFSDALTGILLDDNDEQNIDVLVEVGAHPALQGPSRQVLKSLKLDLPYVATLTRDRPAFESLLATAGQLFALGYPANLAAINSELSLSPAGNIEKSVQGTLLHNLPTYAWDHGKHWAETRLIRESRLRKNRHTVLGAPMPGPPGNHPRWRSYLRLAEIPWLAQHVVDGKTIFPAAGYVSMALEAIATVVPDAAQFQLKDVIFKNALTLTDDEAGTEVLFDLQPLATSAKSFSSKWYRFSIFSFDAAGATLEHCHGLVAAEPGIGRPVQVLAAEEGLVPLRKTTHKRQAADKYYDQLSKMGLQYGKDFRLVRGNVESGSGFSVAELEFEPAEVVSTEADACIVHPTILDSAFHVIFAAIETQAEKNLHEAFVPTYIRSAQFSGLLTEKKLQSDPQRFWVKSDTKLPGARVAINNLSIQSGDSNRCLLKLDGLELTALGNDTQEEEAKRALFFRLRWQPLFSRLATASPLMQFSGLDELVDVAPVKAALRYAGGANGKGRRIRSITPFFPERPAAVDWKELQSSWLELVDLTEPEEAKYDLVILSEPCCPDAAKFLKPGGYLVTQNAALETAGLTPIFQIDKFGCWQAATSSASSEPEKLTILVSSNPSPQSKAIASAVADAWAGEAQILPFTDAPALASNVISLVSLDEEVLFNQHPADESAALHALQRMLSSSANNVVWLLRGATLDTPRPSQAVVVGLMRTLRSENEDVRLATLDLPLDAQPANAAARALEVLTECPSEDELAERDGRLMAPRVETDESLNQKLPVPGNRQPRLERFGGRRLALKIGKTGLLDTLAFEEDEDVASDELGPDDLEIEVRASALNFRDIAASIGIIDDYRLGDEAAGIVLRVGSNVDPALFKAGDRVLAVRPGQGAHRSVVRNPAVLCQRIGDMDFVTATSFEGVLMTAYYSLITVARLQAGEYCLIHSAAGGVGQMAIQLAQMVGANVIATVGSQEKREFLKARFGLGDEMIFSSRDASFVEAVLKATGGRGCDVALNSLAGELLHATWKIIAPFGRLVEIGKRDIHENTKLDMDPFRRNITYASVDLITMFQINRSLLSHLMRESYYLIRDGKINPPAPFQIFSYGEAQKAFRTLQMGKFFGKIILVPDPSEFVPVMPPSYRDVQLFRADKAYLLVGGLGGIGRSLAEWMYRRGARQLSFISRSGARSADAKATVQWLAERGVSVSIFQGDVTKKEDVQKCIETLSHNLAGIFQAAMVLRDVPFAQMTVDQWRACVYPKTYGTHNLHEATKNLDLDFFVCFSSGAAIVGSVGQANYSAANAYLDALMRHRREQGLAGTTMNVGVVQGVGVVAEDAALGTVLDRLGYDAISEEELFYQIEEAVVAPKALGSTAYGVDAHQIVTGINTKRKDVYWATKPIFRNLYANMDLGNEAKRGNGTQNLTVALKKSADAEERVSLLLNAFIEKVAAVMGAPVDTIQAKNPLSAYGLDSIVAVEFRKWFAKTVAVDIPLFDVLGATSIEALVRKVSATMQLGGAASEKTRDAATPADQALLAKRKGVAAVQALDFASITLPAHIPLSSYQSRIWFLHNMLRDPSSLNFAVTAQLEGRPHLELLQEALAELVRRNDILHTRYFEGDNFTEQEVAETFSVDIAYEDLTSAADPEAALQALTQKMRVQPIDIEDGESMRVTLSKLSPAHYSLSFVFHHICLDNGSTKSFMDQFVGLYEALAAKRSTSTVPAPRVTYSEFSVWHNQLLQSPHTLDDLEFWRKTLEDAPATSALLPFATSHRQAERTGERLTVEDTLPMALLKRMKRIASQASATPFHFLIAAFRAFVYRYTEEDDLTILMVDGSRPHPEVGDVLGFFVNMVPLRFNAHCESSFVDLFQHARTVALDALAHNAAPFDSIVNAVGVDRAADAGSHFPLGQMAINYQVYGKPPRYSTGDFDVLDVRNDDIPTACDIALEALEDPAQGGLALNLQYDPTLYGAEDMGRFLQNFVTFLSNAVRDHRQPIKEIGMCGSKELAYLREHLWNVEPAPNHWNGRSVVSRMMLFAEIQPDAIAVETSDGERITYRDIVLRALKVAHRIKDTGAARGDIIAILFQPGIDLVAAMMGASLAGCGYAPFDPGFAAERLHHMIMDSSASIVLLTPDLEPLATEIYGNESAVTRIVLEQDEGPVATPWSYEEMADDDPFYVIYTSGSSGKPKGAVLTHGNTQAMLSSHNTFHGISSRDRVLFHSSPAFDLSVAQIWGALTCGATILLAKQDIRKDPHKLADFMQRGRVTATYFPPTQFALVLEHNSEALRGCSEYRSAIFAGEYLPVRLVKAIYNLGTPVTVFNQWGPSETTVQTTSHKTAYPAALDVNLPIGLPLSNNSHYVLDARLQPVPASVVGEICIGGAQVGKGYLRQPEATTRAYLDDPFASDAFRARGWTTMYKTGDKGRFLADGQLDFKGRISGDRQIKLRGYRIDLAEVENEIHAASLHLSTTVRLIDVAVLPRDIASNNDHLTDDRQLVAILVPSKPCSPEERQEIVNALHVTIRAHLNDYMLPSGYHFTDSLSNLVSGKIGRQHLLSMELDLLFYSPGSKQERGVEANSGSEASQIVESVLNSFKVVLKLPAGQSVSTTQSFFDLGGQSLLLLRLQAALRRQFDIKLNLRDLFAHPTPLGIAKLICAAKGVDFSIVEAPAPFTEGEEAGIDWRAEATLPDEPAYYPHPSAAPSSVFPRSEITEILLTGAETPAGTRMLAHLLSTRPSATITVLGTHAPLSHATIQTLLSALPPSSNNNLPSPPHLLTRIRVLPTAFLASPSPRLGLANHDFHALAARLHAIYHLGAAVSLLAPYTPLLRQANVLAVRALIALAAANPHRRTELHALSTWSVPHLRAWRGTVISSGEGAAFGAEVPPDGFVPPASSSDGAAREKLSFAYFQSRWAAEMLLAAAARRGVPVAIYRGAALAAPPGQVVKQANGVRDKEEEEPGTDNLFLWLLRAMLATGSVPDLGDGAAAVPSGMDVNVVPVDYLVSVVARLAESEDRCSVSGEPAVWHVMNPRALALRDLPGVLADVRADGVAPTVVPVEEWLDEVATLREKKGQGKGAMAEIVAREYVRAGHKMFSLIDTKTRKVLEGLGWSEHECPAVDAEFLRGLLDMKRKA